MGLLTAGLLGGMGKGLADSSETAYKQAMDEKKIAGIQEFQTQRDDIQNQRSVEAATVADTRQVASKRVDFDNQLRVAKETFVFTNEYKQKYGAETMASVHKTVADNGGDWEAALKKAPNTDVFNAIKEVQDYELKKRVAQSSLDSGVASRSSTYSQIDIDKAKEGRAAQTYIDDAKVPKAVQMAYEPIKKEMDIIATALAKAQADGSYDYEKSEPLRQRQALLTKRAQTMLAPYMGGDSGSQNQDKYGIRQGSAANPKVMTEENSNGLGRTSATNTRNVQAQELEKAISQKDPRAIARITKDLERLDVIIANERGTKQPVRDVATPAAALITQTPQKKGLLSAVASTTGDYFSGMGADYATLQGRAELVRRVSEANNGGQQLSSIERMRAQQAGLVK